MSGILGNLKRGVLNYIENDPQMNVLGGILGQYGEEGLNFLQSGGDVDEFMRRRGYEGEVQYPLGAEMTPVIDVLGDAAFTVNSAEDFFQDPSLWGAAKTLGGGVLTALPVSAAMVKAFHGTPHKVDKFRMDKIGTGEGAQAYGSGLYFAENPKVAGQYQRTLFDQNIQEPEVLAKKILTNYDGDTIDAIYQLRQMGRQDSAQLLSDGVDLSKVELPDEAGNLYNVNLNVEPEDLLDWDGGFSDQPENLQKAWKDMWADREADGFFKNVDGTIDEDAVTGRMMYHEIADHQYTKAYVGENNLTKANAMNIEQEASKALKEAGIPGIKYFDGNSRNAGEGTRNFVMFDEDLIEIAEPKRVLGGVDEGVLGGGKVKGGFTTETTDMPLYDDMMKSPEYFKKNKGMTGSIETFTPNEYMTTLNQTSSNTAIDPKLVDEYAQKMANGEDFPMAVIEYQDGKIVNQEGRHRALAAQKAGVSEMPVLIVNRK